MLGLYVFSGLSIILNVILIYYIKSNHFKSKQIVMNYLRRCTEKEIKKDIDMYINNPVHRLDKNKMEKDLKIKMAKEEILKHKIMR